MAEIKPIEVADLNGISLNPEDISMDSLVGYCGYVKNYVASMGDKNEDPEGYQDLINFQEEIKAAQISTFEPDMIDDEHTFENVDLLGENDPIENFPDTYYAMYNGQFLWTCNFNGGVGWDPWYANNANNEIVGTIGVYVKPDGDGITPYDLVQNMQLDELGPNLG